MFLSGCKNLITCVSGGVDNITVSLPFCLVLSSSGEMICDGFSMVAITGLGESAGNRRGSDDCIVV